VGARRNVRRVWQARKRVLSALDVELGR
jgi:hypothetical protein